MTDISPRDALSDAIRYWEPRRVLFNVLLAVVTGTVYMSNFPNARQVRASDLFQQLFILAVLANIAYTAAYPVDILAQMSAYRAQWRRFRWLLFLVGVVFAGILANFFSGGLFSRAI
jgi:hypothetical protein